MKHNSDEVMERLNRRGYLDLEIPEGLDLVSAIKRLKKEKKAVSYRQREARGTRDLIGGASAPAVEAVQARWILRRKILSQARRNP